MAEINPDAKALVEFWRKAGYESWFTKNAAFDDEFRSKFLILHEQAAAGKLDGWQDTPEGSLALLLLLDQFPRNVFRNSLRMYATDPKARDAARRAVAAGHDLAMDKDVRVFFYLPFSHSEDIGDQELAVEKNMALGGVYPEHAIGHRDIVTRFGRFPHRNVIFGRTSSKEELDFLRQGGFAG